MTTFPPSATLPAFPRAESTNVATVRQSLAIKIGRSRYFSRPKLWMSPSCIPERVGLINDSQGGVTVKELRTNS